MDNNFILVISVGPTVHQTGSVVVALQLPPIGYAE